MIQVSFKKSEKKSRGTIFCALLFFNFKKKINNFLVGAWLYARPIYS